MANITYRESSTPTLPASVTTKNAPLTNLELDANFKAIDNDLSARAKKGVNNDITSIGGLTTPLSVSQGGTGGSTVEEAPYAKKGINTDITSIGGLTTPLSVSQGGTGKNSITGLVKGVGTGAMASAVVRTDYAEPTKTLATGILKNTTGTGAHTIAIPADFPILNQDTTGNSANVNGIVSVEHGGTGVGTADAIRTMLGVRLSNKTNTVVISGNTNANSGSYYVAISTLTLTLPLEPVIGDYVGFSNASGVLTCAINNNGKPINSLMETMTVNKLYVAFVLQYADATRGWVFL